MQKVNFFINNIGVPNCVAYIQINQSMFKKKLRNIKKLGKNPKFTFSHYFT